MTCYQFVMIQCSIQTLCCLLVQLVFVCKPMKWLVTVTCGGRPNRLIFLSNAMLMHPCIIHCLQEGEHFVRSFPFDPFILLNTLVFHEVFCTNMLINYDEPLNSMSYISQVILCSVILYFSARHVR